MGKPIRDIIFCLIVFGFGLALILERRLSYPSNVFPYFTIGIIWLAGAVVLAKSVQDLLRIRRERQDRAHTAEESVDESLARATRENRRVLFAAVMGVVYIAVIPSLGFFTSSTVMVIAYSYGMQDKTLAGKKRFFRSAAFSAVLVALVYVIFRIVLNVPAPSGILI